MRLLFRAAIGAALTLLTACATPTRNETPSGKVEATFRNVAVDKAKSALVNMMINRGYRITKDTPYELSFDKPVENLAAQVLLGSKYDSQPNARIAYYLAVNGSDVRVVADLAIITNPGSAFERRTDVNNGADAPAIQAALNDLASSLDTPPPAPAPAPSKKSKR
jgi:hypothetical protein